MVMGDVEQPGVTDTIAVRCYSSTMYGRAGRLHGKGFAIEEVGSKIGEVSGYMRFTWSYMVGEG